MADLRLAGKAVSDEILTENLAARLFHWKAGADRYLVGNGKWKPRWRFQPIKRLEDAFDLLVKLAPHTYEIGRLDSGVFYARIRVADTVSEAHGASQSRALTVAVARALGIEVEAAQ